MIAIVTVAILIGGLLVGGALQRRSLRLRRLCANLLISYVVILLPVTSAEIYFRYVYAASETSLTLTGANWIRRYWHTNSLGFRDREWSSADWAGKETIVVLGDSFAAGWGINHEADRFSNVLATYLGEGYAVINLGMYGTSTPQQLDVLREYPLKNPEVVILQYLLNDIDYAALSLGLLPVPDSTPGWAQESYLVNFIFQRLRERTSQNYWAWAYRAYDNPAIWNVHRGELDAFIDYVEMIGARLIVVIFPNMLDPVGSIAYVDRVAQVFETRGHEEILKLFDVVASWEPQDIFVSGLDGHPSVKLHQYVGQALYERFLESSERKVTKTVGH